MATIPKKGLLIVNRRQASSSSMTKDPNFRLDNHHTRIPLGCAIIQIAQIVQRLVSE